MATTKQAGTGADSPRKAPDAPPPRKRRWGRTALRVLVVVLIIVAVRAWQQRGAASGEAPALEAPDLDGQLVSLAEARGRPVLVHFWATWCGVCTAMDGNVDGVADDYDVIAVASWSGGPAEVREHLAQEGLDMPVVLDPNGTLAQSYGVQAVPTSFVVDPDGNIRHTEVGYTTGLGLRARLWLAGL
ncbi:MAG: protein disulfide oxidoreductase [Myxococcota bacterium]